MAPPISLTFTWFLCVVNVLLDAGTRFSGNFMVKMFVPIVETEYDVTLIEPGVCKLANKWDLPAFDGPKHKQVIKINFYFVLQ